MLEKEYLLNTKMEKILLKKMEMITLKMCQLRCCKPEDSMNDVFSVCLTDQGLELELLDEAVKKLRFNYPFLENLEIWKPVSLWEPFSTIQLSELDESHLSCDSEGADIWFDRKNDSISIKSGKCTIKKKIVSKQTIILSPGDCVYASDFNKNMDMLFSFEEWDAILPFPIL